MKKIQNANIKSTFMYFIKQCLREINYLCKFSLCIFGLSTHNIDFVIILFIFVKYICNIYKVYICTVMANMCI